MSSDYARIHNPLYRKPIHWVRRLNDGHNYPLSDSFPLLSWQCLFCYIFWKDNGIFHLFLYLFFMGLFATRRLDGILLLQDGGLIKLLWGVYGTYTINIVPVCRCICFYLNILHMKTVWSITLIHILLIHVFFLIP